LSKKLSMRERYEAAIGSIAEDIANTGAAERDDRLASRHRLGQYHALRLRLRRKRENVHRMERVDQILALAKANQMQAAAKLRVGHCFANLAIARTAANDEEMGPPLDGHEPSDRLSEKFQILFGRQPADIANHEGVSWNPMPRPEAVAVAA
jgi:hypothetical protein